MRKKTDQYYYYEEADQFIFYRVPKVLFTNERYKGISPEAKLLYGLMLDRMGLSRKNKWLDDDGKTYIYFTMQTCMDMLNVGRDTAIKLYRELETVDLIERRRQGCGLPSKIYVKKFTNRSRKNRPQEVEKTDLKKSEKPTLIRLRSKEIERIILIINQIRKPRRKAGNPW